MTTPDILAAADEIERLRERVAHLERLLLLAAEDYEPHDGVSPAEASRLRDELSHLGQHRCPRIKCTDTPLCRRAAMAGGE